MLTNLVHVLHKWNTDVCLQQVLVVKEVEAKKRAFTGWYIGKKIIYIPKDFFFTPSYFIIVYTAGLYIALTVGMSL